MREPGSEPQPQWRQPPEPRERPFAPYDPTPTYGGPRDNPAPEDLPARSTGVPLPPPDGGGVRPRGLSRRGALGLVAAIAIGGAGYGTAQNHKRQADLTIPADTAQLALTMGSPDVRLSGTTGASAGAVTWNGRSSRPPYDLTTAGTRSTIDVSGNVDALTFNAAAALDLTVETGSGDITGDNLLTRHLGLRTGSGDVSATFAARPEQLSIETGSGDVRLRLPPGDYAFDVSSDSGDISLPTGSGGSTQGAENHPGSVVVTIRTGSGDIDVTVG